LKKKGKRRHHQISAGSIKAIARSDRKGGKREGPTGVLKREKKKGKAIPEFKKKGTRQLKRGAPGAKTKRPEKSVKKKC